MFTVFINFCIWDKHASFTGLGALGICLFAAGKPPVQHPCERSHNEVILLGLCFAAQYKQAPMRAAPGNMEVEVKTAVRTYSLELEGSATLHAAREQICKQVGFCGKLAAWSECCRHV